jgi:hypothetical protein
VAAGASWAAKKICGKARVLRELASKIEGIVLGIERETARILKARDQLADKDNLPV